jgi:hypothetical protein
MAKVLEPLSEGLKAAGQVVGIRSGTEEPSYAVVDRIGAVEIRRYGPRLAADTVANGPEEEARSAGFKRLADYIFGNNSATAQIAMTAPVAQASERIAMTAPVAQTRETSGQWRIRFFMPHNYTRETLPRPNDPAVVIVTVPEETYVVLRFSGSRSGPAVAREQGRLLEALRGSNWRARSEPVGWFYDLPWTIPALRRNEVAVQVTR